MKKNNPLMGLLFLLILILSIPLVIVEEIFKGFPLLIGKVKLHYQWMMVVRNLSR